MIGALAAAGISTAANLVSQGGSFFARGSLNRKTRKYNTKMYERQKKDNLEFWRMQNAYNSPLQQMQRFKAAGLNPNLVYGQGSPGNAGDLSAPSSHSYNPTLPDVQAPDFLGKFYDFKAKQAQINNLGAQNDVLRSEAALKDAQKVATLLDADTSKFDLGVKRQVRDAIVNSKFFDAQLRGSKVHASQMNVQLLEQKYRQLAKTNPLQYRKMKKALEYLGYSTDRIRKESHLVGVSDKTELGSLFRFLFTIFGKQPSDLVR